MSSTTETAPQFENTAREIKVKTPDLPLHCPMPNMVKWNAHPRVFLPILEQGGTARCPYCGTLYCFEGTLPTNHHA